MKLPESPAPFAHWMLREIHEQPATLQATLELYVEGGSFRGEACGPVRAWLGKLRGGAVIAASGSSRHAGMVAETWLEEMAGLPVDVEYASEYSHWRAGREGAGSGLVVVSQSGETADTLAALRRAGAAGRAALAVTNVAGSAMAREAAVSLVTAAGRERAIPATKSFTAQLMVLYLVALLAAEGRGRLGAAEVREALEGLAGVPEAVARQLAGWKAAVRVVAGEFAGVESFLFLGRGVHYAIAREGALKLKESAYLHAEGYPSGELKHGPNALVSERTPLVVLATRDEGDAGSVERYGRTVQLMRDMRVQGARMLAVANAGDAVVAGLADAVVEVEPTTEWLLPMVEVVPLQIFAYWMAVERGIDVDRPRNLVKSVMVE